MNKKIFILFLTILLSLFISFTIYSCNAKYTLDKQFTIANLILDNSPPTFQLISVKNSNTNYENFANCNHTITFKIKLIESNIKTNNFNQNNLKVKVANNYISPTFTKFTLISNSSNELIYEFSITNITNNGKLELFIPPNIVEDFCNNTNSALNISTTIEIDNIPPNLTLEELAQSDSSSLINICSNESIRPLESWNISKNNTNLSKTFLSNTYFPIQVYDYAQNTSEIFISVKKSKSISLFYTTYDSYSSFSSASNGEICAKNTILSNQNNKTESLFVRLENNSNYNLNLLGKTYVHTYWGPGSTILCNFSESSFTHGYNPASNWYTINKDRLLYYNKLLHTQFGGIGLNYPNKKDITYYKAIPPNIANKNLYGISSISFKLNNSDFSVVYQTFIKDYGWIKTCSDGEECILDYDKPISGIRINIIPKTEKQYLIDFWNKDSTFY